MLFVLVWVAWVVCLRGLNSWRASVNDMSAWATWVVSQHGCVCVGGVDGVLR